MNITVTGAAMAASLHSSSIPLSSFSLHHPTSSPSLSFLPKGRNFLSTSPSISISNGGAERLVEARVLSSLIQGPNPKRFLGDDYLVKKVTAKQVQEMVKGERKMPLIVDFYATWCGPCVHMAQELEMLAVEYEDNALFVKVDTDDEYEFARDMQVRGLPTLYFISPDPKKNAIRTEGLVPTSMIKDIIDNEM
ncbi:Thioredoxin [Rhynchospora pubera]|uniref:Thioredoxin-like protein CITRX, chloroplastic n=1 Tax=Rhynchospora pubera TaxID=906938 RepID=A0AAV8C0V2_9POAL|nr:Thioredoxin [Rhynchospora pubera]